MILRPALFALAVAGTLACTSSTTQACNGGCGGGFGWDIGRLYDSLEYRVPYFAAHPPVYYSYPVPRTYGHSPFAYPPHFRTPEIEFAEAPLEITNPYVPAKLQEKEAEQPTERTVSNQQGQQTVTPLVIENPYVTDNRLVRN